MKKLLLTTTALAMGLGVSGAYAMTGAEISLSGSSKWTYSVEDDGAENTDGENDSSFGISNSVTVASSNTSDSGLTYGTSLTLNTSGGDIKDDGMKLFVKGPFGEIRTGTGTAGDSYGIDAGGLVEGEGSEISGSTVGNGGDDNSISYFTPSISGIEAAVSYTDAGTDTKDDVSEIGIKFTTAVAGGDLSLQFAHANASDNGSAGSVSSEATSYGVKFAVSGLELVIAANEVEADGEDLSDAVDVGLSYQLNDDLKFGLYNRNGELLEEDTSETALSLTYTLAPGLSTNLAHTTWEAGDDLDGSSTKAYIKVAF